MSADPLFRENPSVYDRPKGGSREEPEKTQAEYMQKLYGEGLNLYGYVKGNPVRFSDPDGTKAKNYDYDSTANYDTVEKAIEGTQAYVSKNYDEKNQESF